MSTVDARTRWLAGDLAYGGGQMQTRLSSLAAAMTYLQTSGRLTGGGDGTPMPGLGPRPGTDSGGGKRPMQAAGGSGRVGQGGRVGGRVGGSGGRRACSFVLKPLMSASAQRACAASPPPGPPGTSSDGSVSKCMRT